MGRKKQHAEYNDFLDGEKLSDNAEVRTSLQDNVEHVDDSDPEHRFTPSSRPPSSRLQARASAPISPPHRSFPVIKLGPSTPCTSASSPSFNALRPSRAPTTLQARKPPSSPRPTHFLALPLCTSTSRPILQGSLRQLKHKLRTSYPEIPEDAVRPVGTLHLTLGVLYLPGVEDVRRAKDVLKCISFLSLRRPSKASEDGDRGKIEGKSTFTAQDSTEPSRPRESLLRIHLHSLQSMHDPRRTSVLYAYPADYQSAPASSLSASASSPTPSSTRATNQHNAVNTGANSQTHVLALAHTIRSAFTSAGLLLDEGGREFKLHATIVNTVYSKKSGKGRGRGAGSQGKFDATALIEEWEGFDWMGGATVASLAAGDGTGLYHADEDAIVGSPEDGRRDGVRKVRGQGGGQRGFVEIDRVQICKMGAVKVRDGAGNVVDEIYEAVDERLLVYDR